MVSISKTQKDFLGGSSHSGAIQYAKSWLLKVGVRQPVWPWIRVRRRQSCRVNIMLEYVSFEESSRSRFARECRAGSPSLWNSSIPWKHPWRILIRFPSTVRLLSVICPTYFRWIRTFLVLLSIIVPAPPLLFSQTRGKINKYNGCKFGNFLVLWCLYHFSNQELKVFWSVMYLSQVIIMYQVPYLPQTLIACHVSVIYTYWWGVSADTTKNWVFDVQVWDVAWQWLKPVDIEHWSKGGT